MIDKGKWAEGILILAYPCDCKNLLFFLKNFKKKRGARYIIICYNPVTVNVMWGMFELLNSSNHSNAKTSLSVVLLCAIF